MFEKKHFSFGEAPFGVPMTGQLSNHLVDGMRKIYELEPFIKMEISPTEAKSQGPKRYERAS